jgi:hypothetical protein
VGDDDADALAAPERHAHTTARRGQFVRGIREVIERVRERHGHRYFDDLSTIRHR